MTGEASVGVIVRNAGRFACDIISKEGWTRRRLMSESD